MKSLSASCWIMAVQCFFNWGDVTKPHGEESAVHHEHYREMPSHLQGDSLYVFRDMQYRMSWAYVFKNKCAKLQKVQGHRDSCLWRYAHIHSWRSSSIHCTQHACSWKEQGDTRWSQNLRCLEDTATVTAVESWKGKLNWPFQLEVLQQNFKAKGN